MRISFTYVIYIYIYRLNLNKQILTQELKDAKDRQTFINSNFSDSLADYVNIKFNEESIWEKKYAVIMENLILYIFSSELSWFKFVFGDFNKDELMTAIDLSQRFTIGDVVAMSQGR